MNKLVYTYSGLPVYISIATKQQVSAWFAHIQYPASSPPHSSPLPPLLCLTSPLSKAPSSSMGRGNTMVEFFSAEMEFSV